MATYPATTVANDLLRMGQDNDSPITHMKLQKLVYFSHGWHLVVADGEKLVEEPIRAWQYGPVIRELYDVFAQYERNPIEILYSEFVMSNRRIRTHEPSVPQGDETAKAVIDRVWEVYGDLTAFQLSEMTHEEGTPWHETREARQSIIPNETIREHFRQLTKTPA